MKVLVTGGLGYLGCIVVQRLLKEGFEVRVLDSMLYGKHIDEKKLEFELMQGDVRNTDTISKALENADAVIHLAAIVGEPAVNLDKENSVNVNYLAVRELAQLAKEKGVRLVFTSTCSVYGASTGKLLNEKSKVFPLSIYAISKLAAEEAIEKINGDFIIFRLGTLFGLSPRMRFDLVVNRFVAQGIQDKKISVFGGSQFRPFVHVQDVASAFVKAIKTDNKGLFNLGGSNYRIADLAELLAEKTNCEVVTIKEIKDPRNYAVDSKLFEKAFDLRFEKDVEFAINEIMAAYSHKVVKNYKEPIYNNEEWLRKQTK
jgi:nucleoside-diphosphate-sugar epimerase